MGFGFSRPRVTRVLITVDQPLVEKSADFYGTNNVCWFFYCSLADHLFYRGLHLIPFNPAQQQVNNSDFSLKRFGAKSPIVYRFDSRFGFGYRFWLLGQIQIRIQVQVCVRVNLDSWISWARHHLSGLWPIMSARHGHIWFVRLKDNLCHGGDRGVWGIFWSVIYYSILYVCVCFFILLLIDRICSTLVLHSKKQQKDISSTYR